MVRTQSKKDAPGDSSPDYIIAVMGMTGAGKSTFIDVVARQNGVGVGHGLKSETAKVTGTSYRDNQGRSFLFIDTPGFDDTYLSDTQVLRMIADWLKTNYDQHKRLTGIIYCHRISDNRLAGSALKNLRMFGKLCGNKAAERVVLVSTMWDKTTSQENAEHREQELRSTYWKLLLANGCKIGRFDRSSEQGWSIVNQLVAANASEPKGSLHDPLLLQEELSILRKHLSETNAGMALYDTLQQLLADQKEIVRRLRDDAKADPDLHAALDKEYRKVSEDLEKTFRQVKEMKVPFSRRIAALFSRKKPQAQAVEVEVS